MSMGTARGNLRSPESKSSSFPCGLPQEATRPSEHAVSLGKPLSPTYATKLAHCDARTAAVRHTAPAPAIPGEPENASPAQTAGQGCGPPHLASLILHLKLAKPGFVQPSRHAWLPGLQATVNTSEHPTLAASTTKSQWNPAHCADSGYQPGPTSFRTHMGNTHILNLKFALCIVFLSFCVGDHRALAIREAGWASCIPARRMVAAAHLSSLQHLSVCCVRDRADISPRGTWTDLQTQGWRKRRARSGPRGSWMQEDGGPGQDPGILGSWDGGAWL